MAIRCYLKGLLFTKHGIISWSKSQPFHTSYFQLTRKQELVPYPWKNHDYQNPKFQYVSKIRDSDLTQENQEALLEERVELSEMMNASRQQILRTEPWPRHEYIAHKTQRCGLIGYKLGMMPHWTNTGKRMSVTIYQIMDNVALNYIPPTEVENLFKSQRYYMKFKDDYPTWVTQRRWGLQFVGAISADPSQFTVDYAGLFTKYGVNPRRKLARFLVSEDAAIEPGRELSAQHFRLGDYIDVTGRSSNYGFQGVMVRHGFKGGPAGHSCTKFHRRGGAIGHGTKVLRGQGMPGVMGNRMRTIRGLQIVRMDYKYNLLYLGGITPGPLHSYAHLCDTWLQYRIEKRELPPAMPTAYDTDDDWVHWTEDNEDAFIDLIHQFDQPSITYTEAGNK